MERTRNEKAQLIEALAIEAFKSTGYLILNKCLLSQLGLVQAAVLSNYIDKHLKYSQTREGYDGWFYCTHAQQATDLGLSEYAVRTAKAELLNLDLLEVKRAGTPAKEFIKIHFEKVATFARLVISNSGGQVISNSGGQVISNSGGHIKQELNNKNKKIIYAKIVPPRLAWVKEYCTKRNKGVDPVKFYNHYKANGWKVGKVQMVNWQAAVRTWEINESYYSGASTKPVIRPNSTEPHKYPTKGWTPAVVGATEEWKQRKIKITDDDGTGEIME
jgi:ribosomal protein L24E